MPLSTPPSARSTTEAGLGGVEDAKLSLGDSVVRKNPSQQTAVGPVVRDAPTTDTSYTAKRPDGRERTACLCLCAVGMRPVTPAFANAVRHSPVPDTFAVDGPLVTAQSATRQVAEPTNDIYMDTVAAGTEIHVVPDTGSCVGWDAVKQVASKVSSEGTATG